MTRAEEDAPMFPAEEVEACRERPGCIRRAARWVWKHGDAVSDAGVAIVIGHDLMKD